MKKCKKCNVIIKDLKETSSDGFIELVVCENCNEEKSNNSKKLLNE